MQTQLKVFEHEHGCYRLCMYHDNDIVSLFCDGCCYAAAHDPTADDDHHL